MIDTSRPIIQMSLEGKFINEFETIKKAGRQFGGKVKDFIKISRAANINSKYVKKTDIALGFRWKFKE